VVFRYAILANLWLSEII